MNMGVSTIEYGIPRCRYPVGTVGAPGSGVQAPVLIIFFPFENATYILYTLHMLAHVYSCAGNVLEGVTVEVRADTSSGLP